MNAIELNIDAYSVDPADVEALAKVLHKLSVYAEWKAIAMRYRLKGQIKDALETEKDMDNLYKELPEWARW